MALLPNETNVTSPEIERLLNPIYCSYLLGTFSNSYSTANEKDAIYPVIFLCLPMVLHSLTREIIVKHTRNYNLHRLVRENPEVLILLTERVNGFIEVTKEALIIGHNYGLIKINQESSTVTSNSEQIKTIDELFSNDEEKNILKAVNLLGHWLGKINAGDAFVHLGLRF